MSFSLETMLILGVKNPIYTSVNCAPKVGHNVNGYER